MKKLIFLFALLFVCQLTVLAENKTLLEYKIEQQNKKIDALNKKLEIIEANRLQFERQEYLIKDLENDLGKKYNANLIRYDNIVSLFREDLKSESNRLLSFGAMAIAIMAFIGSGTIVFCINTAIKKLVNRVLIKRVDSKSKVVLERIETKANESIGKVEEKSKDSIGKVEEKSKESQILLKQLKKASEKAENENKDLGDKLQRVFVDLQEKYKDIKLPPEDEDTKKELKRLSRKLNEFKELKNLTANDWYLKGLSLHDDNPIESVKCFTKALKIEPFHLDSLINRGNLYINEFDAIKLAEKDYLAALKSGPNSPVIHNNLGHLYLKTKSFDKSEFHLNKSIEYNKNYSTPYRNRALLYAQLRNPKAEQDIKKWSSLDSNNKFVNNTLGVFYSLINNYEKSFEYYDKAIEQDSTNKMPYINKAELLVMNSKFEDYKKIRNTLDAFDISKKEKIIILFLDCISEKLQGYEISKIDKKFHDELNSDDLIKISWGFDEIENKLVIDDFETDDKKYIEFQIQKIKTNQNKYYEQLMEKLT